MGPESLFDSSSNGRHGAADADTVQVALKPCILVASTPPGMLSQWRKFWRDFKDENVTTRAKVVARNEANSSKQNDCCHDSNLVVATRDVAGIRW
jgi:hypothetical protein